MTMSERARESMTMSERASESMTMSERASESMTMTERAARGGVAVRADYPPLALATFTAEQIQQRHLERLLPVDSLTGDRFDRMTHLAATIFGVPMATVTLVAGAGTATRSELSSHVARVALTAVSDEPSFTALTIGTARALLVPDATADERFARLPVVTGPPYLRFYAGIPLVDDDGVVLGAFCLYDSVPRRLDSTQWATFVELASWVCRELLDSEEMAQARRVQESLLPRSAPVLPGWEVAGICLPTKSVGGDFYDFAMVGGRLVLSLVDVMGKGAGAALVAATVRALLHASFSEVALGVGSRRDGNDTRPFRGGVGGVVADVDRLVRPDLDRTGTLVTGFFCDIDPHSGAARYADAGHGLTVVVRAEGEAIWLRSADLPIGVDPNGTWTQQETSIDPGDTLLTVSDGLLDLFGGTGQALAAIAQLSRSHPRAADLIAHIGTLAENGTPVDDVTAVAVHRDRGPR